jgi:L-fuconolactonase
MVIDYGPPMGAARRTDAHQHFRRIARADYDWLPASGPLVRDFLPVDLRPLTAGAGIGIAPG